MKVTMIDFQIPASNNSRLAHTQMTPTPRKTNMEPENHPFEKEKHLNQTFMTLGSSR